MSSNRTAFTPVNPRAALSSIQSLLKDPSNAVSRTHPRNTNVQRVQNLTTILHISLLRRDIPRAQRAFSVLLRCERQGVTLKAMWELGQEILMRSSGVSKVKVEEFLQRVRLSSSGIGHHPTTEKEMIVLFNALIVVMVRQGKYKEVLDVVNDELLNWPYNKAETVQCYAEMLNNHIKSLREEQDMTDN